VDQYFDGRGARRSQLFLELFQVMIGLSPEGSEERNVLENLMNHARGRGQEAAETMVMTFMKEESEEITEGTES